MHSKHAMNQSMRKEITREVEDISRNLQESCLRKLSGDAKLALEKVSSLSSKLDDTQKELMESQKEVSCLREDLSSKKIRLEISESLLMEMLKQMQRKINSRKNVSVQVNVVNRRNAQSSLKDRESFLMPTLKR